MNLLCCLNFGKNENINQLQLYKIEKDKNNISKKNESKTKKNSKEIILENENNNTLIGGTYYCLYKYKFLSDHISHDNEYNINKKKYINPEMNIKSNINSENSQKIIGIQTYLPIYYPIKEGSYFGDEQLKSISFKGNSEINIDSDRRKKTNIYKNDIECLKRNLYNIKRNYINYKTLGKQKSKYTIDNDNEEEIFSNNQILTSFSDINLLSSRSRNKENQFKEKKDNIFFISKKYISLNEILNKNKNKNYIKKKNLKNNKKGFISYINNRNNNYLNFILNSKNSKMNKILDKTNCDSNNNIYTTFFETFNNADIKESQNALFKNKVKYNRKMINNFSSIFKDNNIDYSSYTFIKNPLINSTKCQTMFKRKNKSFKNTSQKVFSNPFKYNNDEKKEKNDKKNIRNILLKKINDC